MALPNITLRFLNTLDQEDKDELLVALGYPPAAVGELPVTKDCIDRLVDEARDMPDFQSASVQRSVNHRGYEVEVRFKFSNRPILVA